MSRSSLDFRLFIDMLAAAVILTENYVSVIFFILLL